MAPEPAQLGLGAVAGIVLLLGVVVVLVVWWSRAPRLRPEQLRQLLGAPLESLPSQGLVVPVHVIFGGVSAASSLALSKNSLFPKLTFFPDRVAIRMLGTQQVPWREVREADLVSALVAPLLILHFSNGKCISARLVDDAWRIRALRLLQHCGVPLGAHAQGFLQRGQHDAAAG
jgi:hypothetical protein